MKIELGTINDISKITKTVSYCIIDLIDKKIYQWNENHPTNEIFINDINNNELFIIKDDNICIGVIVLNEHQANEWRTVQWSKLNSRPLIIHRLIVHPAFQRRGIGRTLIDFAINYTKTNKFDSIRFDVYSGNPDLIKTYEKMGCVKRGEVMFPYRELPFFCYELDLNI